MATSEKRTLEIRAKLSDQMTKPLGGMEASVARWAKRTLGAAKSVFQSVFNLRSAVIGLAASFVSLATIKSFGEQADALVKLSTSTGDAVENLSELQAALQLAGGKADSMGPTLRALLKQVRDVKEGNLQAAAAFGELGISIDDLDRLGPSQLFERIAAGLDQFGTAQEKAVALGKLLPKQFLELLPLLGGGLQKFQQQIRDVRAVGATVTAEQARAAEQLNDGLQKVQFAIGGVSRALLQEFGPPVTLLFESLAKSISENRDGIVQVAKAIGETMTTAFNLAVTGLIELVGVIESIPGVNLVDEEDLKRQIRNLKDDLGIIDQFRNQTASKRRAEIKSQLADEETRLRIGFKGVRQLTEELAHLQNTISMGNMEKFVLNKLLPNEAAIRERLQTLEATLSGGLKASLQRTREQLARELAAGVQQLRVPVQVDLQLSEDAKSVFTGPASAPLLGGAEDASEVLADNLGRAAGYAEQIRAKIADVSRVAFFGSFWDGFSLGAKDAIAQWTDFEAAGREAAQSIIGGGLDGIVDALSQTMLRTEGSSQAWRRLGQTAVAELSRIALKLAIVNALSGVFGAPAGGIQLAKGGVVEGDMGRPVRARAFARGGVTNGPTLALFGEGRNREAFVPLPDNRSIPVTLNGGGGGGSTQVVNFHVTAMDGRDVQRLLLEQGSTIGAIIRSQMETQTGFRQVLQRTAG